MTTDNSRSGHQIDLPDSPSTLLLATAAGVDDPGTTFVVLTWAPQPDLLGYNLYRRPAEKDPPKAPRPINGKPIEPVRTSGQLKGLLSEKSRGWNLLAQGFTSLALRENPAADQVDPGTAFDRGLTEAEEKLFETLADTDLDLRLARGLAFLDRKVDAEERYVYELRGVLADGTEVPLAGNVGVWAGHFVLPDPPSGLTLVAGDHKVLALWNRNPYAATFAVQRSTSLGGPYQAVNVEPVVYDVDSGVDGQPVSPPRPGFLDYQRWDADGLPTSHEVDGTAVVGPENGSTYYYRVASQDVLGRLGSWSAALPATPVRSTPPMAPDEVQVSVQLSPPGLTMSWRKVTRDVDNHQLPDLTQTYHVYRSSGREDLEDITNLPTWEVTSVFANPQDPWTATITWTDTDPVLVPPYGETTFFYRLRCADPYANTSAPSAVVSGRVPDRTPPLATALDGADGFVDHLTVYWKPNAEPDLAGYLVYRGVCNRGLLYKPGEDKEHRGGKCDLTLVGQVPLADSAAMLKSDGRIHFDDYSVPEGSPVCYGYWVRAYDVAQNLYQGDGGCPKQGDYVCVRLLEETPPPAPVVTGLRARDNGVLVEWVASPVQDLHAFHIYRSAKEFDPPQFIACVLTDGSVHATPWRRQQPACADIPAEPDPVAARGHYLDATAVPHEVYWYRVSALDWLANESEGAKLKNLPSSSTFTYTSDLPVTPSVLPPSGLPVVGCGLEITWEPTFDASVQEGFVVFRSTAGGPYRQVSGVLAANEFSDPTARRAVDYFYCVQSVDKVGRLSTPSVPVLHRY